MAPKYLQEQEVITTNNSERRRRLQVHLACIGKIKFIYNEPNVIMFLL